MSVEVFVRILPEGEGLPVPKPATPGSSGVDLMAAVTEPVTLKPGDRMLIQTGVSVSVPRGYEWQIRPRSGLALKHGVTVLNSPGTVDSDYRGPVGVILVNHGEEDFTVNRGDRIAQAVLARVEAVSVTVADQLAKTERGHGGFGHTGV
jgi:dUTP pyrophosphatase